MQTLYEAAGATKGLLRLAHAWHTRVMADDEVSHAFSHGYHPQHTERLAAYWAEALGGPAAWATNTTMSRYHDSADDVPDGLSIPRWSWDGLDDGTSS